MYCAIHSTNIQTGPTGKSGPPQNVDQFFRNFSGFRTDPLSFAPKFPEILVEWIAPVQSHSWHVKVLDFASFRSWYVREFELSHSNLVSRVIKISHAHNLHVNMLDFALFYN